jgi:hypothetical protein
VPGGVQEHIRDLAEALMDLWAVWAAAAPAWPCSQWQHCMDQ